MLDTCYDTHIDVGSAIQGIEDSHVLGVPPFLHDHRLLVLEVQHANLPYLFIYVCMYVYILNNPLTHWENVNNGFE